MPRIDIKTHRDGLCGKCRESLVFEQIDGTVTYLCNSRSSVPLVITKPVIKCNDFDDRNHASRYELEKIAWVVRTDKSGKAIGFKPPDKERD